MRKDIGKHSGKRSVAVIGLLILAVVFALPGFAAAQDCTLTVAPTSNSPVCDNDTLNFYSNVSGAIGNLTYSWSRDDAGWTDNVENPTQTADSGDNATFTVVVTDDGATSCSASGSTVVTVCMPPTTDAGSDAAICAGESATLGGNPTADGGTGPYTYVWSPTTGLDSATAAKPIATSGATAVSSSIVYTVVVTDTGAGSCSACTGSDEMVLTICGNPVADAGSDETVCAGDDVQLGGSPTATGGTGPYTYAWSPTTNLSSATAANPTASLAATTVSSSITYTVTVTATGCNSCTDSDEVKLTICPKPDVADAGDDQAVCAGGSAVLGPGELPIGNYEYSWTPEDGLDDPSLPNPTVTTSASSPSTSVTYTLVMTELDCNSCTDGDEMVLTINELPECQITVDDSASDGIVEPGSTHTAWIPDPGPGATIEWVVEDGNGVDLIVGPGDEVTVAFKAPLEPTTIKIAVSVDDANTCGCEFDPPVDVIDPDPQAGILKVWHYIPTLAGWGLIGLVALMAGAGAWVVRRRKRS